MLHAIEDELLEDEPESLEDIMHDIIHDKVINFNATHLTGELGLWVSVFLRAYADCFSDNKLIAERALEWMRNTKDWRTGSCNWIAQHVGFENSLDSIRAKLIEKKHGRALMAVKLTL